jgi:ATP-dependent RNA helicase RhlE
MKFADLRLAEPILRSLHQERYEAPTPIQAKAIPPILTGRDLLGCAQTGTGKTAAFALPILHRLTSGSNRGASRNTIRCLLLAPTRELALQIDESFRVYGRHLQLRHAVVFGGVSQHAQVQALRHGVDALVATPGRLLDLMNQGHADLRGVEVFVLDEADRMLDMGFIHDIRKIVQRLPKQRQNLMFSATMPPDIRALAGTILHDPAFVEVAPAATTVEKVDQSVYFVERQNKPQLLAHLINHTAISRALVFTRTKHGADRVVRQLHNAGIRAEAIHGNKSQNVRQRALANFKSGKTPILIASDIAARGIDVDDISHVFNYDLTHEPETYVHRIGRTARAGAEGHAISFCDADERDNLRVIEKLIRQQLRIEHDQPLYEKAQREARSHHPARAHQLSQPHHRAAHRAPNARSRGMRTRSAASLASTATMPRPAQAGPSHRPVRSPHPTTRRIQHPLDRRTGRKYTMSHAKH